MNSNEFLKKLETLLQGISEEERSEALRFYSEYFSEAGPEQEQAILKELVSPEHVAAAILQSLPDSAKADAQQAAEVPEKVAELPASELSAIPVPVYRQHQGYTPPNPEPATYSAGKRGKSGTTTLLLVLLVVLTSPIWLGLLAGLFGILVGILATGVAFLVAGVITAVASPVVLLLNLKVIATLSLGSNLMGLGLILLSMALGLLMTGAGGFLLFWVVPAAVRLVKKLVCALVGKRGGVV